MLAILGNTSRITFTKNSGFSYERDDVPDTLLGRRLRDGLGAGGGSISGIGGGGRTGLETSANLLQVHEFQSGEYNGWEWGKRDIGRCQVDFVGLDGGT